MFVYNSATYFIYKIFIIAKLNHMNTDIYSNIILHIRDVDSLVSLYLTNITFQQLLNTRYIYTQLAKKFNIVADITNFKCLIGITSYQKPYTLVYAIDEYNNIYLFLEFVIINADRDVLAKILDYHDVYDFYYKIGDRCKYSSFMMIESLTE